MTERISNLVRSANARYLPFYVWLLLVASGGILFAGPLGPWVMATVWAVAGDWPVGSRICFFGAYAASVCFLFGAVNLTLRAIDSDALEVELPAVLPMIQVIRKVRRLDALSWSAGLAALFLGLVIGKTIFT